MIALLLSAIVCQADFSGAWDRGAWKDVRQLKWDRGTPFVQTKEGLVNWSDERWSDEEIFAKHQIDTCSAMVLTNRFSGPMSFVTRTSFDHRMAPAIVIAANLRKDGKGRDGLGDFFEIVLFDEGLNVWKHVWSDGQERVSKVAYLSARYEPQEPYALTVTVCPKKAQGRPALDIRVSCDGHTLGFRDETFPHEYYAGILGAEGRCRFMSFAAATDVAEIALDERPQYLRTIRVNQVGYAAHAPKLAEVPAAFPFKTFTVQTMTPDVTWVDVYTGEFTAPKGLYKYADFSCVTNPGDYRVVCGDAPRIAGNIRDRVGAYSSNWFKVHDGVYDPLQRMLFGFYTWQRCGSEKGWPGVCHQDRVPLVGAGRTLDMRGGYHQSDDLRCWADDTARAVWHLFWWAEKADFPWDGGTIAEELRWGADYFEKLVGERGYAWDCQFEPIGWGPRNYYATPAPMAAQFCVLHALCRAARYFRVRDAAFAAKCLAKAESVMRELETNPSFDKPYEPPTEIPPGSQPASFYRTAYRGHPNVDAAFVSAAIELYEASGKAVCREKAEAFGEKMLRTYDGVEHGGCCGLNDFVRFAPFRAFNLTGDGRYKAILRRQCDDYIRDAWNHQKIRSTQAPAGKGVVLTEGYRIFGDRDCLVAAQKGLDWDLGVNRHEQSFVNGIGRNTQPHEAWGQFYPSTPYIPGAVVHIMDGEYNLPNAGILLILAQRLNSLARNF